MMEKFMMKITDEEIKDGADNETRGPEEMRESIEKNKFEKITEKLIG